MFQEQEVRKFLEREDFSFVKKRLQKKKKDGGENWSKKYAEEVEGQYKGFLFVCCKYKNEKHAPTKDIDIFWHNHILYTKKYTDFSKRLCGRFLHHEPNE